MKKLYTLHQSIFSMKHIWKLSLLIFIFCTVSNTEAQVRPIGNPEGDTVLTACSWGDDLYFLTGRTDVYEHPNRRITALDTFLLKRWDGSSLKVVDSFVRYHKYDTNTIHTTWINKMIVYNNKLIIAGSFDSIVGVEGAYDMMQWDGKKFSAFGNGTGEKDPQKRIDDVFIHDGILFVTGKFNNIGGVAVENVACWNGKIWYKFKYQSPFKYIVSSGRKLYKVTDVIHVLDSSGWQIVDNLWLGIQDHVYPVVGTYKDDIILPQGDTIFIYDGTNRAALTNGLNNLNGWRLSSIIDFKQFKNDLWATAMFDKGVNTQMFMSIIKWDGVKWKHVPSINTSMFGFMKLFATDKDLFVYGYFDSINGKKIHSIGRLSNYASITGKVYIDNDSNCRYDSTDIPSPNHLVNILPANDIYNTDDSGNYEIYVDSGEVNLKVILKKYFTQFCPGNDSFIIITPVLDSTYSGNDFAVSAFYNVQDVRVTLSGSTGWRARQGFTESYTLCYENVGTTTASGTVSLLLDSNFTNFSSSPNALNYTFPVAEWKFDSLQIGEKRCITFKARLDSAAIDDSVMFIAAFDGGDSWKDSSYDDNVDTLKQRIVAALDPNDKTSKPEGNITKKTKELRYHIRFQNVGSDTAYRVTVIDTIDTNLPLTKIMMNSASHKYKLDIKNNVFKWTFDGIMLPDSNVDEEKSHGFINYTAQIKQGLAIGTEIKNTAYIYFDYQKPVITNTARSRMVEESVGIREEKIQSISGDLHIYPNPASARIILKNTGNKIVNGVIFNGLGQQIETIRLAPFDTFEYNIDYLPNGIYFIQAENEKTQKLIIQH